MANSPELRKPVDWQDEYKMRVFDGEGWREYSSLGPKDWDEPISREEYEKRMHDSTVVTNRNYRPTS